MLNPFTPEQPSEVHRLVGTLSPRTVRFEIESKADTLTYSASAKSEGDDITAIRRRRLRILVVDDHQEFRSSVVRNLKQVYGAEVEEEESGDSALSRASAEFDLVLMDIWMPGSIDGLEACEEIRKHAMALEIVLMTGAASPKLRERAAALGVRLLSKPLDYHTLEGILLACSGGSPS